MANTVQNLAQTNMQWPWILGKRNDQVYLFGSVLASFVLFFLYHGLVSFFGLTEPQSIAVVLFIFVGFFDNPHIFQGFSRTHADPYERQRHFWQHQFLLIALLIFGWSCLHLNQLEFFFMLFDTVGFYHIYRQNVGFMRLYMKKCNQRERVYEIFYAVVFFLCFFNDMLLYTKEVQYWIGWNLEPFKELFKQLVQFFFWLNLGWFFVYVAYKKVNDHIFNASLVTFILLTTITHYFIFFVFILSIPATLLVAMETAYHDLQYQGYIQHYQKKVLQYKPKKRIIWLLACMSLGAITAYIATGGSAFVPIFGSSFLSHINIAVLSIIFYHYIADGFIWKTRMQPELKALL